MGLYCALSTVSGRRIGLSGFRNAEGKRSQCGRKLKGPDKREIGAYSRPFVGGGEISRSVS